MFLDENGDLFLSPDNEEILMKLYFPMEFRDMDFNRNIHSFYGQKHFCPVAYKIVDGKLISF